MSEPFQPPVVPFVADVVDRVEMVDVVGAVQVVVPVSIIEAALSLRCAEMTFVSTG